MTGRPEGVAQKGTVWTEQWDALHRLFGWLSGTRHTLLVFNRQQRDDEVKEPNLPLTEFQELVESCLIIPGTSRRSGEQEGTAKRLYDPDGSLAQRYGLADGGLALIRPDGYLGYRSRSVVGDPCAGTCTPSS